MSQFSMNNALLIAFLFACSLLSFQSHAQLQCQNAELSFDEEGQLTIMPESIMLGQSAQGVDYQVDPQFFDCSQTGMYAVNLIATYSNGDQETCVSAVKVQDTTAPSLEVEDMIVYLSEDGTVSPNMYSAIRVEDNCTEEADLDLRFSQYVFNVHHLGEANDVKIEARDAYGNLSLGQFLVKVLPAPVEDDGSPQLPVLNLDKYEETFEFYPNPSTSLITLNGNGTELGTVTILNSNGKEVLSFESEETKTQIDIDKLPTGMYFIECNSKVKKFIKK